MATGLLIPGLENIVRGRILSSVVRIFIYLFHIRINLSVARFVRLFNHFFVQEFCLVIAQRPHQKYGLSFIGRTTPTDFVILP